MQFTTITVACLSALAASVSAQNAAADAMTQGATAAYNTADAVDLTSTSTTTSTTTRTVSYAHTVTRASAASTLPTGGYMGSNSTTSGVVSPAQPSSSDSAGPVPYDSGAGAYIVSQGLFAALGLGAIAFVAL